MDDVLSLKHSIQSFIILFTLTKVKSVLVIRFSKFLYILLMKKKFSLDFSTGCIDWLYDDEFSKFIYSAAAPFFKLGRI